MKVGFLIIGRLKSTRLPKKVLLPLEGKPFLEHMFDHVRLSQKTNVIVMCTSTNPEDDPIEECAKRNGIECFRGDEDDVVKRLYDAAVKYNLDYILTITADCPWVDPIYADKVVEAFVRTNADLITAMDLPHGAFTHGMKPAALKTILDIKDSKDTEVWGRYFSDTGLFETYRMPIEDLKFKRSDIRMTLDYPEDYEFFKAASKGLYQPGKVFSLETLIDYLDAHPEVAAINKDCGAKYLARYTRQSEIKLRQRFNPRKVVVFGSGSIGQRHMRNLKKLGYNDIAAFRTQKGHYKALPGDLGVQEFSDWAQVASFKPDVAIISNPTSLHIETAKKILPFVKGILIEKPISHTQEGVAALLDEAKKNKVVTFVGYNLQLHPAIAAIRTEMDKGTLGKPICYQCQVGLWLPDWHPYEDFTKAYYAQKDLGGGVALTLIHEINLALKLLGPASRVAGIFPASDKLAINVDTNANLMLQHANGSISQIHLDYLQKPMSRSGSISFEAGWIQYDLINPKVIMRTQSGKIPDVIYENNRFDADEMYINELKLFLRYTSEGRIRHDLDGYNALEDLKVVEAAFASSCGNRMMEIKQ